MSSLSLDTASAGDARSDASPALVLKNVRLSLGEGAARVDVLRDLSLTLPKGKAIAIVGPSGCGKSTLLMAMAGLERIDSGEIHVGDAALHAMNEDARAAFRGASYGIVFQSFHLMPTMTALENVALPLELAGAPDAQARARQELGNVGLGERLHHYPRQMSGGEQQRTALARALVGAPALILADEPTGNLDEATGAGVIDLMLQAQRARGATLVLVTHDTGLAARCDMRVRLRAGVVEAVEVENLG
jgi:putative ABC transport system ATP-binding protein